MVVLLLVAGACSTGAAAQSTGATTIDSCTTIDEPGEYVLTSDVSNSGADACIHISASDVVLDGGGHTVDGVDRRWTYGVLVRGPGTPSNVTVTNVVTTDWWAGIQYQGVTNGRITDAAADNNVLLGIQLGETTDTLVANTSVASNGAGVDRAYRGDGIRVRNGSGNTLRDVVVEDNDLMGIRLLSTARNTVRDATSRRNRFGVFLHGGAHDNTVVNGRFTDNNRDGMTIRYGSDRNEFLYNRVVDNGRDTPTNDGDGIEVLHSDGNLVQGNVVRGNPSDGIAVNNGTDWNRVLDNVASDNGRTGILVTLDATGNTVANNTVTRNEGTGLYVRDAPGTAVRRNTAEANAHTGIIVRNASDAALRGTRPVGTTGRG